MQRKLYITKNQDIIDWDNLSDEIEEIEVEEGNPDYYASGNCLIEKKSATLVAACMNSVIPDDGSIRAIGPFAFNRFFLMNCSLPMDPLYLPRSVRIVGERAFAVQTEKDMHIIVPEGTQKVERMAFMVCENTKNRP